MEGFPRFCQLALITANIMALVKSVEMTFIGATLFVLDPAVTMVVKVVADDLHAGHLVRLLALFMLITGPLILVAGVAGLSGSYRESNGWLAVYLGLLIILITAILTLCAVGIPSSLVDPSSKWRPLSDFMLTSIVFFLATLGVLIFFTIVLMSALAKEDGQVHPKADNNNTKGARPQPMGRRT